MSGTSLDQVSARSPDIAPRFSGGVTAAVRNVLADKEWHSRDEITEIAGKLIPPGKAKRENERSRKAAHGHDHTAPEERRMPMSDEDMVRSGRRRYVNHALRYVVRKGYAECVGNSYRAL